MTKAKLSVIHRIARRVLFVAAILSVVGCDRVTKHLASVSLAGEPSRSYFADLVRLRYVENTGGFLSLGADWPDSVRLPIFVGGTGLMLILLTVYAFGLRASGWRLFGLSLFIAGGVSNWADRFAHGSVVDFLNVGIGPLRTGVFNVADMALLAGIGVLVLAEFRNGREIHDRP